MTGSSRAAGVARLASSKAMASVAALLLLLLAAVCPSPSAQAAQAADACAGWRRDGTGVYPDAQPPVKWSATENVLWKTPLPGKSNASPILVGDRIFFCSEPSTLLCASAKDGTILWSRSNTYLDSVPEGPAATALADQARADSLHRKLKELEADKRQVADDLKQAPDDAALKAKLASLERQITDAGEALKYVKYFALPPTDGPTGYASPTPTSDGTRVYAVFGTGMVACYDLEGRRQWMRLVEKPKSAFSSSPLLVGGLLLVHFGKATALDPATGETRWQAELPYGAQFGSPARMRVGGVEVVAAPSGEIIRVSDGKILSPQLAYALHSSPIAAGDTFYFIQDNGGAVRLTPSAGGGVTAERVWKSPLPWGFYIASPVYADGLLYTVMDKTFYVLDAGTGQEVYTQKLDLKDWKFSLVMAGPYLYCSNEHGETLVIQPGRKFKEIAHNTLGSFWASPIFSGKRMYIRGQANLYCVGSE